MGSGKTEGTEERFSELQDRKQKFPRIGRKWIKNEQCPRNMWHPWHLCHHIKEDVVKEIITKLYGGSLT
jgi:hypothetical protein